MKIILGTMNFGPQLDLEGSRVMIQSFLKTGFNELDTAYVYNNGDTERYLGEVLPDMEGYYLATKVHPRITGKLDRECILMEFNESLKRMNRDKVDLLYFHFPDGKTPIDEALETVAELYEQGKVKELGLSNYPAWQVVDIGINVRSMVARNRLYIRECIMPYVAMWSLNCFLQSVLWVCASMLSIRWLVVC